jgi:hypothetical protein
VFRVSLPQLVTVLPTYKTFNDPGTLKPWDCFHTEGCQEAPAHLDDLGRGRNPSWALYPIGDCYINKGSAYGQEALLLARKTDSISCKFSTLPRDSLVDHTASRSRESQLQKAGSREGYDESLKYSVPHLACQCDTAA